MVIFFKNQHEFFYFIHSVLASVKHSKMSSKHQLGCYIAFLLNVKYIPLIQADLDEMAHEGGLSNEKAQKAMIDAARLADELRGEQELAQSLDRERKLLEAQVKDLQTRLDDAEQNALKGGKKAMSKMDSRIRELESELDAENRRLGDAQKNLRKSERKIKELTYQQDEDRKNHERMQVHTEE
jgi:predicted  nucleic acid-binding Zn-ribbon protein